MPGTPSYRGLAEINNADAGGDNHHVAMPRRTESRLSVGAGGMELSESEISDHVMHELRADELQRLSSPTGAPVDAEPASDEDGAAGGTPAGSRRAAEGGEVRPPHGWPPLNRFSRWYWCRLTGFDQSLDVYGVYPSYDQLIAFVFVVITMIVLGLMEMYVFHPIGNHTLSVFLPAFGASCTTLYALPKAPISQPRNVIAAHVSAAIIGVGLTNAFRSVPRPPFGSQCAGAIGVGLHLVLMMFTNTMHPPASATVISASTHQINAFVQDEGFLFVVTPVLLGAIITTVCAWLLNNLVESRSPYPQYW